MTTRTMQLRLTAGRGEVRVEGPDDADVVITLSGADAELDPAVAFMIGKLKTSGSTGALLDALADGRVAAALSRLASRA